MDRMRRHYVTWFVFSLTQAYLPAQGIPPDSRAEEIQRARQARAAKLVPEQTSKAEEFLRRFKDQKYLERFAAGYNGLRVKLGGLVTGGGFALGPEYLREDLFRGNIRFRSAAQISFRNYQRLDAELNFPKLAANHAFLDFYAVHHNYPGVQYYGPGPDSARTGRTAYRLEDTAADATFGVVPVRGLKIGTSAGGLWMNIGPGTDNRFASTELVYSPAQAPGIDRQTNFFRFGTFAQLDYRDNPKGPKAGGNYVIQYSRYEDIDLGLHDFNRIEIELQQHVPFFNRTRRFALRAKTVLTDTAAGQEVPFYLRPVVGGSDDLRGFRPFRFVDRNSLVLNGEYRWEIFSGLDGALFVDGGKVFARRGQLNFANLEGSAGFGLRFNARNQTFLRVDAGFSHEGFQVWFKFNDLFSQRPFGTSSTQPVF
jgi:outer membrane protein assembly factor BamA